MATTTKKPSTDVIRSEATSLYEPQYQAVLDQLAAGETTLDTAYNRNVADVKSTLVDTLADTRQSIENSLLKRGMGRSSRAGFELGQGVEKVTSEVNKSLEEILQDYNTNKMSLQQQKQTLASTFQQSVAAKISELNQWYDQLQLSYDQLAASTSGGGGSGGTNNLTDLMDLLNQYLNEPEGTPALYGGNNQGYSTQGYGGTSSAAKKATASRGTNVSTRAKKSAWYEQYYS
jgi:hypothetical protein